MVGHDDTWGADHPIYPFDKFFVFLGLSGYLFRREYFEVVALSRPDRMAIWPVRQRVEGYLPRVGIVRRFEGLQRLVPHLLAP